MKQYETIVLKGAETVINQNRKAQLQQTSPCLTTPKQDCLALLVVEAVLIPILRTAVASEFQQNQFTVSWVAAPISIFE